MPPSARPCLASSIAARMKELQDKTDEGSKQQLDGLKKAYEAIKAQLMNGNAQVEKPIEIKAAPVQPPVKKN